MLCKHGNIAPCVECDIGTLEAENEALRTMMAKLVEALEGLLAIVDESLGVSGYHLNGSSAPWCEFGGVAMAEEALALYRKQGGEL